MKKCQFVRCQGNGDYMEGNFCKCYENYGGENCEIKLVDEECSNYGIMFFDDYGRQKYNTIYYNKYYKTIYIIYDS